MDSGLRNVHVVAIVVVEQEVLVEVLSSNPKSTVLAVGSLSLCFEHVHVVVCC